MDLKVTAVTGDDITPYLDDLAQLRMTVFHDWPYLYDGTVAYEKDYLATFSAAKGAVCVIALDGKKVIGAATAAPMIEHADEFGAPFEAAGYNLKDIFYCSESVLLTDYRGHGLGHAFFYEREAHAKRLGGFTHSTFCRVIRPDDHPLKPASYRALDGFWRKRGYQPVDGLIATYTWKDIGEAEDTEHKMQFWMKPL